MNEFAKYIIAKYNVKIIKGGISRDDGFFYIFQLSPQQQCRICSLKKSEIDKFVIKAQMMMADKMGLILAQNTGKYEILQGGLILSGSKEFIDLMLFQLFDNTGY